MTILGPTQRCPSCGKEVLSGAVTCPSCGSALRALSVPSPPPPPVIVQSPPVIVQTPEENNLLGNVSLFIGILSAVTIFGLALCAATSIRWRIIEITDEPLAICALTMAFLSLIGGWLGVAALFPRRQRRATAIVGLFLCTLACCILWIVLSLLSRMTAGP